MHEEEAGVWQQTVYLAQSDALSLRRMRRFAYRALVRDNHCCQVMECSAKHQTGVHHIIPRSEGGGDNIENLITLCYYHHNLVEELGLRTVTLIVNVSEAEEAEEEVTIWEENPANDWHIWVYGGVRNPRR
jgi:5-methylcytosine-specific restriction endonuclease McrA